MVGPLQVDVLNDVEQCRATENDRVGASWNYHEGRRFRVRRALVASKKGDGNVCDADHAEWYFSVNAIDVQGRWRAWCRETELVPCVLSNQVHSGP